LKNILTYEITENEDIDSVVMVASRPSRDELYHALVGKIDEFTSLPMPLIPIGIPSVRMMQLKLVTKSRWLCKRKTLG
jgi:hypothetical protein